MKKYIVVAVDVGETVDGHSSLLGTFNTKAEAEKYVKEDMKDIVYSRGCPIVDEVGLEVWTNEDKTQGCVWDIFEIPLDNKETI